MYSQFLFLTLTGNYFVPATSEDSILENHVCKASVVLTMTARLQPPCHKEDTDKMHQQKMNAGTQILMHRHLPV